MNRNSLIWHILLDITTFIFRVHQGSIFHISEPMYHEIQGGGGERIVLMKQAVFIKEKKKKYFETRGRGNFAKWGKRISSRKTNGKVGKAS